MHVIHLDYVHIALQESELQVCDHPCYLYGHTGKVNQIVVCKPYSVLVSCSEDNTCIIWDLNR